MKNQIPSLENMTLREKINQTIVVLMAKDKKINFAPARHSFSVRSSPKPTKRDLTNCEDTSRSLPTDVTFHR